MTEKGLPVAPAGGGTDEMMIIGIRPEDLEPAGGKQPASVSVIENMGPTKILLVDWAGHEVHIVTPATFQVKPGDTVFPRVEPSRIVLWPIEDIASGR